MTDVWLTIAALTVGTLALKAVGPLTTGGRRPSERALGVTQLVAPAILAGLVVYETLTVDGSGMTFDARIVGLGAAALALLARAPILVVVLAAAVATALARAVA
jgi:branched-subunit amino acid transport protein AzlD